MFSRKRAISLLCAACMLCSLIIMALPAPVYGASLSEQLEQARQEKEALENQIKAIRSFIASDVDVISFCPIVETGWDTVLQEAKDAGIPVVLVDRGVTADPSLYVTHIFADALKEGANAFNWVDEYMTAEGKTPRAGGDQFQVAILEGTVGSSVAADRLQGFNDAMAESPNSGKYNVICSQTGEYTRAKGMEVMESFLKSDGDKIDILFSCNGDMALGAIQAIEAAGLKPGEDIVIVSIDAAKGEFLLFVDSDDLLEPDAVRRAVDAQRQQDADLVIFNLTYVDEENRPLPQPDFSGFTDEILDEDGVWQRCFALAETRIYYVVAWNKLYRRSLFQHLRYAPGKRYEDQFLLPHLLAQCKTIACLAAPGYRYVQRSGSIMAQGSSRTYLDRPEYLLDWCAYFTQKGDALRAEGLLNDAIQNLAEKQCFDLSTPAQQARYRAACRACADSYTALAAATGQRSMRLRAALLRIGLPAYQAFLKHKT